MTRSIATAEHYHTLNPKDNDNWLAGGELYNESKAGGELFDPFNPITEFKKKSPSHTSLISNSNINFLNKGMNSITSLLMGASYLDLLYEDVKTTVFVYKITIADKRDGTVVYHNEDFIDVANDGNSQAGTSQNKESMSVSDFAKGYNSTTSVNINSPLSLTISVMNMATSQEATFSQSVAGTLAHTVVDTFASKATSAITSQMSFSSLNQAIGFNIGINFGIGALFGEAFEVLTGLDNHFGFGGDYLGVDNKGNAQYAQPKSIEQGLRDMVPDFVRDLFNMDTTYGDLHSAIETSDYSDFTTGKNAFNMDITQLQYTDPFTMDNIQIEQSLDGTVIDSMHDINAQIAKDKTDYNKAIEEANNWAKSLSGGNGGFDSHGFSGLDAETEADINDADFGIDAQNSF